MYLIERIWVDVLENDVFHAYGWEIIGLCTTKKEADRIVSLKTMSKKDFPWPLSYAHEIEGETFYVFKATKLEFLDNLSLKELELHPSIKT